VTPEQNGEYAHAVANSQKRFERAFELKLK
jgi:hypothetical protein